MVPPTPPDTGALTTQLGEDGERCRSCGAPLARDQRYCLNCGVRRAESRVPFPQTLASTAGATGAVLATSAGAIGPGGAAGDGGEPAHAKRGWTDRDLLLPVLGSGLLALAVGILIGQSSGSDPVPAKAPVVNLTAGGVAPAASTAAADTGSGSGSSGSSGSSSSSKTDKKAKSTKATVSTSQLKSTQNATGDAYVKKAQKLPTTLSTGGKPPPKDNKKAGGGSSVQTIG